MSYELQLSALNACKTVCEIASRRYGSWLKARSSWLSLPHLTQVLVYHLHRNRPFPHSGSDSLDRRMPSIASGKNAGNDTLKNERIAVFLPSLRPVTVPRKKRSSEQITALVHRQFPPQPARARDSSYKDEEGAGGHRPSLFCRVVENGDRGQVILTMCLHHLRLQLDLNIGDLPNLLDQVLRHALLERIPTHQHRHRSRELCEIHRSLPRRVRTT